MNNLSNRLQRLSPSETLAMSQKSNELKAQGIDVINLSVGEPDFNTPQRVVNAGIEALKKGRTKYTPSSGLPELKKAICKKLLKENGLSYRPEQVVVSNGAKHSVFNVCFTLLDEGDEVIIPEPYWLTYPEVVKVCGGVVKALPCKKETNINSRRKS